MSEFRRAGIVAAHDGNGPPQPGKNGDMRSRLNQIENWEALARSARYCPRSLAALCGVSRRQLERYCQWAFQQCPRECLRRLRIEAARRYLAEGFSVKATAYELGFKQVSHFSRVFKHAVGVSPAHFTSLRSVRGDHGWVDAHLDNCDGRA